MEDARETGRATGELGRELDREIDLGRNRLTVQVMIALNVIFLVVDACNEVDYLILPANDAEIVSMKLHSGLNVLRTSVVLLRIHLVQPLYCKRPDLKDIPKSENKN